MYKSTSLPQRNLRWYYLFLIPLLSFGTRPSPEDPNLLTDLTDCGKAYRINRKIDDKNEWIRLCLAQSGKESWQKAASEGISLCQTLSAITFSDTAVQTKVSTWIKQTITEYQSVQKYNPTSAPIKTQHAKYEKQNKVFTDFLVQHFAMSRFINLTEDKYWSTMDKSKYIHSPRYATYKKLIKQDPKAAVALLDSIAGKTADFQEKCIYQMEIADQLVKNAEKLGHKESEAISRYKSILDQSQYNLYLFETWVKWRTLTQQHEHGLSKSSDIPNDEYDAMRDRVAGVILVYIAGHPKDEMAINQFLVITTHWIVMRFGSYPYGNQNTVEYHEIFDN